MRRKLIIAASVLALVFLMVAQAGTKEITVRGSLGRTVETGGWLILADKEKYLLLNAKKFQKESWFREGVQVEAVGQLKPGTITVYQEGVPFEARTVRPLKTNSQG
jgi:hypothetical protein